MQEGVMAEINATPKKLENVTQQKKTEKNQLGFTGEVGDVFQNIRATFIDTIKRLTGYQKEFEKIISDYSVKGNKYQEDISGIVEVWFGVLHKVQNDLSGMVKETFNGYMPSNMNLPFAVEYEKMVLQIQDMFKRFFNAFPVFNKE